MQVSSTASFLMSIVQHVNHPNMKVLSKILIVGCILQYSNRDIVGVIEGYLDFFNLRYIAARASAVSEQFWNSQRV